MRSPVLRWAAFADVVMGKLPSTCQTNRQVEADKYTPPICRCLNLHIGVAVLHHGDLATTTTAYAGEAHGLIHWAYTVDAYAHSGIRQPNPCTDTPDVCAHAHIDLHHARLPTTDRALPRQHLDRKTFRGLCRAQMVDARRNFLIYTASRGSSNMSATWCLFARSRNAQPMQ